VRAHRAHVECVRRAATITAAFPRRIHMLKVRDIMTAEVVSVTPRTTLRDAIELFAKRHVSGAPVMDGDEVVGVVSTSDVLSFEASNTGGPPERDEVQWSALDDAESDAVVQAEIDAEDEPTAEYFTEEWDDAGSDVAEQISAFESPEWDILEEHAVGEIMTHKLLAVRPDAPVTEAARLMKQSGVHRVFVTEKHRIVGVVSAIDIAHAVAEGEFSAAE
jgi:CBS domain-containing protein